MLQVQNLFAGYGKISILKAIDLAIKSGECVILLGANGSGKTTLLRAICGLLPPQRGSILLDGCDLASMSEKERAKKVAVMPQKIFLPEGVTVRQMVLLGRYAHLSWLGLYSAQDYALADRMLELTGTTCFANSPVTQLSGGELQRVILARTLAQDSRLILLDELSSGLDPATVIELFDLLENLRKAGYGFLSVMHDCNLAVRYATRLIGLKQGQILFDGAIEEVFTEKLLSELYDCPMRILHHPDWLFPQVVPVATHGSVASSLSNCAFFT